MRIAGLLADAPPAIWQRQVPACPGWSVRDVVSHMTAVAQDWAAGRLSGAPTDEETAEHVARFRSCDEAEILGTWSDATSRLRELAETAGLEPPLGDIACHEHDIRSAIGRRVPGLPSRCAGPPTACSRCCIRHCRYGSSSKTVSTAAAPSTEPRCDCRPRCSKRSDGGQDVVVALSLPR